MRSLTFTRNLAGTIEALLTTKFKAPPPKINALLIDKTYFDYKINSSEVIVTLSEYEYGETMTISSDDNELLGKIDFEIKRILEGDFKVENCQGS